mmetsp:Transcript_12932/g.26743  ORF Transcript_12932/g.26743 Transcript_12932/m.26743 type:complete len:517 (+) Transcript_12932:113-1663(+)
MSDDAAGQKTSIKDELLKLQKAGLAKQHQAKYKSSDTGDGAGSLMTPEEAKTFLAEQKTASKKGTINPTPPQGLSSGDLDSWYTQQKQREIEARKKREEAEAILRGYRGAWDGSKSGSGGGGGNGSSSALSSSSLESGPEPSDARGVFQAMDSQASSAGVGEGGTTVKNWRKSAAASGEEKKLDFDDEKKNEATWNFINNAPGSKYAPETGRYHIYVSLACPWSHRVLMVRALKGLQNVVSMTVVHPIWQRTAPSSPTDRHCGWVFADPESDTPLTNADGVGGPFPAAYAKNSPDPVLGAFSMRDIYEQAGDADGKYTVPVLYDISTGTIVSKESWQIMRMLNACFNEFAENPSLDLYPPAERNRIDEVADWMYPAFSNGVYRCGFAMTQKAYDESIDSLVNAFDRIESILKTQRYICGPNMTEADVRLFVTLLRFDEIYALYFKCNARSVSSSSVLLDYCRDVYQMDGIKETIDMEQCMAHYYCSHTELNKYSIIPRGVGFVKKLEEPHDRAGVS